MSVDLDAGFLDSTAGYRTPTGFDPDGLVSQGGAELALGFVMEPRWGSEPR